MKVIRSLISKYRYLKSCYHRIWRAPNDFNVPLLTRIKYARHLFTANEYHWFNFEENYYGEYISDFERIKSRDINGEYKLILDDKLLFEEVFKHYIKVPQNYAWVSSGVVYGRNGYDITNDNIMQFLIEKKETVLKWIRGYEGKGTFIIRYDNGFVVNDKEKSYEEVKSLFNAFGQAILCEYMHQSKFEDSLYPYATNTLRIICAKKKGEKNARIIAAVQRIGDAESKPVDNVSAGALACTIDLETGELDAAVLAKSHNIDTVKQYYIEHPDTGAVLKGKVIPNWSDVKAQILNLTNQFPFLNFVAWDVLLTDEGICIIEGNASAGLMMFQVKQGVRNSEIGEIYRSYGIIK